MCVCCPKIQNISSFNLNKKGARTQHSAHNSRARNIRVYVYVCVYSIMYNRIQRAHESKEHNSHATTERTYTGTRGRRTTDTRHTTRHDHGGRRRTTGQRPTAHDKTSAQRPSKGAKAQAPKPAHSQRPTDSADASQRHRLQALHILPHSTHFSLLAHRLLTIAHGSHPRASSIPLYSATA